MTLIQDGATVTPADQPRRSSPFSSSINSISKDELYSATKTSSGDSVRVDDGLQDPIDEKPRFMDVIFRRKHLQPADLGSIATRRSVFDDPVLAKHYWPTEKYENLHRFDPDARWTFAEERAVVRKIDWRVMLWAAINLRMTTNDYNLGNSLFRLSFLAAELPSQLVSKRLGPDRWIPMQMCMWSIVTMGQFFLTGRASFLACRALLGFIQGGFIPDLILYLSYYYTKTELPIRLSLFWMSSNLCSIAASFLAYGVLHLRGHLGKAGWRWLFLVEGSITLAIAISTFFMMPPSPTQSRTWFRPNGWFTEREETIIVSRILRDDPTKGDMHNREGLSLKRLWMAVCDYDLWPVYILGLTFGIPVAPPNAYLTLSLRNLGFGTFETNLLVIPSTVLGLISMFLVTLLSEAVNDRARVSMLEDLWALPFLIAIYCLPENPSPWLFYGLATALLAYPYTHPIQVGWCSRNSGAVASRTVNASLYNMFVQASAIISANIYRADDAPRYHRGNRILITISAVNLCVLYPGTKLYYMWRNRQRERVWDKMTPKEQSHYLAMTKDVGNRRLDFRFAH
ncbi:allantoate permease [Fomitiporia mediterranea MF3/22]|uniref:allantoate permease n=1 Tax=Fomitiporia mediterranea (strain MF3/22) TaxID=694068 RepID=UPI00044087BD|nr:allantoate permease [Fomitiporia mediterranea MF3/22]EJD08468.1 allantoate permease [Fomitiporia mediterranea MF3/22]